MLLKRLEGSLNISCHRIVEWHCRAPFRPGALGAWWQLPVSHASAACQQRYARLRTVRLTAAHKDHGSGSTDDQTAQPAPFDQTAQPAAAPAVSLESDPWAWRKQQLGRVAKFCGPAVAIPLADPLMSLVDNICVARFSGTLELAALAPCTLIFSMGYIFNALSIATLSSVAESVQAGDDATAERSLSAALFVGFVMGLAVWALFHTRATQLIAWTGCDAALWEPAVAYLKIRAIAAPFVLVTMCAQAGLLAQQDAVTPLLVVLLSGLVNLVGDFLLITRYGMGICGAAWATAGSQILGTVALLAMLRVVSKVKPVLRLPSRRDLSILASTLGPMTLIYLCKNLTYIQLQLTATVLAPLTLAAHQLLYSLWTLTSFVTVPLEQAALTFLPAARDRFESSELARLIVAIGTCAGVAGGIVAAGLPLVAPNLFTHDLALYPIMHSVLPQVFLAMLLCGLEVSSNGLLVAKKDLGFVCRSMVITMSVSSSALLAVRMRGWGISGVWWGLCIFFAMRGAQSVPRLLKLFPQSYRRDANGSAGPALAN